MGLWDNLFGKKVRIQGHDENGNVIAKKVSEHQLREWEAAGRLSKIDVVEVHVLDPNGSYTTHWKVGTDIPIDLVEQYRDPESQALYAVTVYEAGKPETMVATKSKWLEVKAAMGE